MIGDTEAGWENHNTGGGVTIDFSDMHEGFNTGLKVRMGSLMEWHGIKFFLLVLSETGWGFCFCKGYTSELWRFPSYPRKCHHHCKKNPAQLPAVEMQHAPANLPSKFNMFAYVDVLAQSLKFGVKTEASWEFLHINCRQLSKFFLQCSVYENTSAAPSWSHFNSTELQQVLRLYSQAHVICACDMCCLYLLCLFLSLIPISYVLILESHSFCLEKQSFFSEKYVVQKPKLLHSIGYEKLTNNSFPTPVIYGTCYWVWYFQLILEKHLVLVPNMKKTQLNKKETFIEKRQSVQSELFEKFLEFNWSWLTKGNLLSNLQFLSQHHAKFHVKTCQVTCS
ncbi:hypothetical protein VP01_3433g3 [Puccinia sorghi]|uniref:Uncharacterized protein n=1 Tax=Puccinia sorghi TaxID=27349 RepID=A0A0L6UWD4_9BASI|nr:hypothetical protein VP01_3433g3 [Puccinia sorghi]